MTKISSLTILTVPCDKIFVVSKDKTASFKNNQINEKLRKQNKELCKKITQYIKSNNI